MADTPTIYLYSDPTYSVILPGFTAKSLNTGPNGAFVQFEGDQRSRFLRGGGGTGAWSVTAIFWRTDYFQAFILKNMLLNQEVWDDPRLVLVPGGITTIIQPSIVICQSWTESVNPVGSGIKQFEMQLTEVQG